MTNDAENIVTITTNKEKGIKEMVIQEDASYKEAENAMELFEFLRQGLRIREGRVMTAWGAKTPLGLYRSIHKHMGLGTKTSGGKLRQRRK